MTKSLDVAMHNFFMMYQLSKYIPSPNTFVGKSTFVYKSLGVRSAGRFLWHWVYFLPFPVLSGPLGAPVGHLAASRPIAINKREQRMGTLTIDLFLCSITPSHLIPVLKATDYCAQLPSPFCHYPVGIAPPRERTRENQFLSPDFSYSTGLVVS